MDGDRKTTIGLGPVGLAGIGVLLLGILVRSRLLALLVLAGVVADVTVPELGGFKALNEPRPEPPTPDAG